MSAAIVSRAEWGCRVTPPKAMTLPAREVWLHHSVTAVSHDAPGDMRTIERIGRERFGHISYSWCFHPDGTVLEGAGLQVGAHTAGRNSTSFGFCLIGDYTDREPSPAQVDGVRLLVARLVSMAALRPGVYPTGGHRDLKPTACPGDRAYARLAAFRAPWGEKVAPMFDPPHTLEPIVAELVPPDGRGVWLLGAGGGVYAYGGAPFRGAPAGLAYFAGRHAARLEGNARGGYDVVATSGERYSYPTEGL